MHSQYNRHWQHQNNHITNNVRKRAPDVKCLSTSACTPHEMIKICKMRSADEELCECVCDCLQDEKYHHHTDEFIDCEWRREDAIIQKQDGEFGHVEEEVVQNLNCEEVSESDDYFLRVIFVEVCLVIADHGAFDVSFF